MILPIVKYGHPVLRQPGKNICRVDDSIKQLARDMIETMDEAHGLGLAAQQVGEALQLFVLNVPQMEDRPSRLLIEGKEVELHAHMPMVLINPEIAGGREKEKETEGCLSFPEILGDINRSLKVKVKATGLDGNTFEFKAEGLLARAIQHEGDHIKGVLFIDRMDTITKLSLRKEVAAIREKTEELLRIAKA